MPNWAVNGTHNGVASVGLVPRPGCAVVRPLRSTLGGERHDQSRPRSQQHMKLLYSFQWAHFLWCVALAPIAILLHELSHQVVGVAVGFPAQLHFASVSGIPEAAPFGGNPVSVALASLAGPAMSMSLMAIGAHFSKRPWGLPLVAVNVPRFVVNVVFLVQQALVVAGVFKAGESRFDEATAANALGWSAVALGSVGALFFFFGLVWLWRRAKGAGFIALALGTASGAFIWLQLLGPLLLP